jgi:AcrR family transcriptional regulator
VDSIKIDETLLIPTGRHTLAPDEVEERQKQRLLRAIVACVAEKGYKDTTIADVVRVARTSRSAFYEHFANKQVCFLEAYEQMTAAFIQASLDAAGPLPGWREKLHAGISTYFEWMAAHPEVAISTVHGVGREALEARSRALRLWMRTLEGVAVLARRSGASVEPPQAAYQAIVLTAEAEVHEYARGGRVKRVGERAAPVIELADSLYL